ncbi:MAG TPA: hypothetical protein VLF91_01000 [Candidatus Saccharimonadales bacterium]|nr:hypothetical protein [Candidatus Saccharimonadales bacterium]
MSPLQQTIQQAQPTPSDSQVDSSATDSTTTDELDKEWINKAKVIVNQTKSDPYTESKALGKVKSEYMKIRYNKDIKLAEDTHR